MYKSIFIKDSDRTKDVKRTILEKFLLNPETCDKYSLIQVFNHTSNQKELPIGDNCNVFYAARNEPEMEFVLRRRINTGLSMSNGALNGASTNTPNIVSYTQQKSSSSTGSNQSTRTSISPMLIRNKLVNFSLTPGSKSKSKMAGFGNTQGSISLNDFDHLPPQSPNFQNSRIESSPSNNNWKFFKKINI